MRTSSFNITLAVGLRSLWEKANRTSSNIKTSDWPDRPYSGAVTAKGGAIRVSANGFIFHIARRKQSETITD